MNKRIDNKIILENNFIFIYGYIYDIFCNNNLEIKTLDYIMQDYLRKYYEKIIFIDTNNIIYSLDEKNNYFTNTEKLNVLGPLGNINLIQKKENIYEKSFINSILFLDKNLTENNSTCIIFKDFHLISPDFIGEESFKFLKNKLIEWTKIYKDNKFIFLFDLNNIEDIMKNIEENKLLFLKNYIKTNNIFKIDYPDEKEIYYLLNNLRILNNVNVDWEIFRKIPKLLEIEKIILKNIYDKFQKFKYFNKNVLKRLLTERFLKNTNLYLINNIQKEFSFNLFKNDFNKIKGQSLVKEKIINLLDIWYKSNNKSISFVFIGNSFVGKTLTVEILTNIMNNFSYKKVIINNNNYRNIFIEEKSIIVFEDIETINPEVWNKFLFLFKDSRENNHIIILNSSKKINNLEGDFIDFHNQSKIRKIFIEINKEIFSNIDYFIIYKNISLKVKKKIIKDEINKIVVENGFNLLNISKEFINKYLEQNINSTNIKDIKNDIKYKISKIIIDLKKQNPNLKDISI